MNWQMNCRNKGYNLIHQSPQRQRTTNWNKRVICLEYLLVGGRPVGHLTMQARTSNSLILFLYMKAILANQVNGHFAHFVQRDQHEIIGSLSSNDGYGG